VSDQRHSVEHPISSIAVREDGILEFRYHDGAYMQLEDAQSLIRAALELVGAREPLPTIVYLGQVRGSTRESREYMANSEENQRLSSRVALIVSSRAGRMLVNLLFALSPPRMPTRAFTDDRAALTWLENPQHSSPSRRLIFDEDGGPDGVS
jgi:hypothetical protein